MSSFTSRFKNSHFQHLNEDQRIKIHNAALYILEKVGIQIFDQDCLSMLHDEGARIENKKAYIPEHLVNKALSLAPSLVTLYDRDGNRPLYLQGKNVYFGSGPNCITTLISITYFHASEL